MGGGAVEVVPGGGAEAGIAFRAATALCAQEFLVLVPIDGLERKGDMTYSLKPFTSSASSCFRLSAFLCSSSRMDSRNWISSSSRARNWFAERGSLSFKNKQVVDAFGEDAGIHT